MGGASGEVMVLMRDRNYAVAVAGAIALFSLGWWWVRARRYVLSFGGVGVGEDDLLIK